MATITIINYNRKTFIAQATGIIPVPLTSLESSACNACKY
jgi:hypothetical protein